MQSPVKGGENQAYFDVPDYRVSLCNNQIVDEISLKIDVLLTMYVYGLVNLLSLTMFLALKTMYCPL